MNPTIQLLQVSPEELTDMISAAVSRILTPKADELLTPAQAAEFMQLHPTTLIAWRNAGKITGYGIGSEVRYKKSDLLDAWQRIESKKTAGKGGS